MDKDFKDIDWDNYDFPEVISADGDSNDISYDITSETAELTPEEAAVTSPAELRQRAINALSNTNNDFITPVESLMVLKEAKDLFNSKYRYDLVVHKDDGGVSYTFFTLSFVTTDPESIDAGEGRAWFVSVPIEESELPKEEQK